MTRLERYYLLSVFGGGKPLDYLSVIQLGTLHLANPQNRKDIFAGTNTFRGVKNYQHAFERMFKQGLEYGLIKQVESNKVKQLRLQKSYLIEKEDYDYLITPKGDECLRMEQIARAGDYSYYKNFERTTDSAAKINPGLFK